MPAPCYFCVNNSHDPNDPPPCNRAMITKEEAWQLIGNNRKRKFHVYRNPAVNALVGIDWARKDIKDLLEKSQFVELALKNGHARKMKHGVVAFWEGKHYYIEALEEAIDAFEKLHNG